MQDARMLLPGGARRRVLLRAGHPQMERLEKRLDAHLEHFPVSEKEGGKAAVDNAILAHRLCNRLDHSLRVGRSHGRDLERIRNAREEATRRNKVRIGNKEGGEIPTEEAKASRPTPKNTKKAPGGGSRCLTPRWLSTSSTTRRSPTAPGRTSLGSRARSVTPLSVASWDSRRRLNADPGGLSLGGHSRTLAQATRTGIGPSAARSLEAAARGCPPDRAPLGADRCAVPKRPPTRSPA
jgi:hypothetical protein